MAHPDVLLVSLPWTALGEPSLGLGVLQSVLAAENIPCRIRHLNLFMLRYVRATTYLALANTFALNDFVFSGVLEPDVSAHQMRHVRSRVQEMLTLGLIRAEEYGGEDGVIDRILTLRQEIVPAWLGEEADAIAASGVTLVGCTCMFDQTVASLALARLLRERAPDIMIAFGGYALRPPTGQEIIRCFPFVDAVCVTEGEDVIVPLARASAGERALADVPGILYRTAEGTVRATPPPPPLEMDRSPVPDFDDYFRDLEELRRHDRIEIDVDTLPFETSRGCWWGQVKHCVFCGIDDADMAYRARSAGNVLAALDTLAGRYRIRSFRFSDYILPHQYHTTLLPALAECGAPYRLACEMKANSTAEKFGQLAAAGFVEVQPGIESFSTDVLRRMDKGVTALLNVQTLLLGRRFGVHIHYNILYGLPDDTAEVYRAMIDVLPRLFHLDPPLTRTEIQITRYAPLQARPARFGIPEARYEPSYEVLFSPGFLHRTGFDLNAFCYYFQRPFDNGPAIQALFRALIDAVDLWKRLHASRPVVLWYEQTDDGMVFRDSRTEPDGVMYVVDNLTARVYDACVHRPVTAAAVAATVGCTEEELAAPLALLDGYGLLFRDGHMMLGLALPRACYEQQEAHADRLWAVA